MTLKKVLVLVPDGLGYRNFLDTRFPEYAQAEGLELIFWNATSLKIDSLKDDELLDYTLEGYNSWTALYCRIRKRIELNIWTREFKDDVYQMYKFPVAYKGIKGQLKNLLVRTFELLWSSPKGLKKVRKKIENLERESQRYKDCLQQLKDIQPEVVFVTNQRSPKAIAGVIAAKDLGIPTVCMIHSWDNVPKAMNVIEPDHYLVWSDLMKAQLLKYYKYVTSEMVTVTGTPQFEFHFDEELKMDRKDFFDQYDLDPERTYICFSGDDITTSPLDQYYLEDLALAVKALNKQGKNLHIIYRRCPVDLSDRYDKVLSQYEEVITPIAPKWEVQGGVWNEILPKPEDTNLLYNICEHSEMVANVCSSTVFDFVLHQKPCIYFNYEQPQLRPGIRDIGQNYQYVHFRSMPSESAVVYCKDKVQLHEQIRQILALDLVTIKECHDWFEIVAGAEASNSSKKIIKGLSLIQKLRAID